ncbi:lytic transglycosylase domain-containing protein [Enterovirga rhinocerotis]|uniref:Soluble lytic murein transglycosylase-like protein n=1 Tax=Enterovirga rhinocerotis TaxID=1339210 RepID=A0A4R7BTF4_9HYPH|nr:lytic transglycosylase domain-containing protein [Enterovirga rhinocerotis]TDR89028.1 soluble lytic murein transglycosylase-like protein [Enterovirga rhinocerotis]
MLSRFLPAGVAALAVAISLPALAEPAPVSGGLIPPRKPDFGAARPSAEARKPAPARTAAIDPQALAPAKADAATPPGMAAAPPTGRDAAASEPGTEERTKRRRSRAAKAAAEPAVEAAPAPAQPAPPANPLQALFGGAGAAAAPASQAAAAAPAASGAAMNRSQLDARIAHHARINNVPESLVHRVVIRESRYNPRAVGRGGAMGLMQIKTATARGVGYQGGPAGLLDAETNLTYAVKYLAGAWRVSGGSHDRAVMHYARGYYYEAKRQGLAGPNRTARRGGRPEATPAVAAAPAPAQPPTLFSFFAQ